jgi:hypothetical protein
MTGLVWNISNSTEKTTRFQVAIVFLLKVLLNTSDMADSCQRTYSFLPNWFPAVFVMFKSRLLSEAEPLWRRLITLIFAGWLPPDLASSRSCLCLST